MDKLESWGMVDEQEYSDIFGWTTEDAYKVKIMEMTEDQMVQYMRNLKNAKLFGHLVINNYYELQRLA